MNNLLIFGLGYTARALVNQLSSEDWTISATARTDEGVSAIEELGYRGFKFNSDDPAHPVLKAAVEEATHIVVSVPPGRDGDPVLRNLSDDLAAAERLTWIGYMSTIGVYGDHQGAWVDEVTPATPQSVRSKQRRAAEEAWQSLANERGARLQIFRLAGIYGPGRSAIDRVRSGTARAVIKPRQVFNRIHVADAASVIKAGLEGAGTEVAYNLADDLPAPPEDVLDYAAELLGANAPPRVNISDAGLSEMALSFYSENKRVRNGRIKQDLGIKLSYPTYREGLAAIAEQTA